MRALRNPCGMSFGLALMLAAPLGAHAEGPQDKLNVWAGHWKIAEETFDTQFEHAGHSSFDAKCSWLPNHSYLVCDYLKEQREADGHFVDDASLLYYSPADKAYKYTAVATEGGPQEQVVSVEGNIWTRMFQTRRRSGGMAELRFTYDYASPTTHLARFEISTDKGAHWTLISRFVAKKVG